MSELLQAGPRLMDVRHPDGRRQVMCAMMKPMPVGSKMLNRGIVGKRSFGRKPPFPPSHGIPIAMAELLFDDALSQQGTKSLRPFQRQNCKPAKASTRTVFESMTAVIQDLRARRGSAILFHPVYELYQWLEAEDLICRRWPRHRGRYVPSHLLERIGSMRP